MPASPATTKGGGGRAGFLNAKTSAAIAETIKKEERSLQRLLQQQIALGRITLPDEDAEPGTATAAADDLPVSQEAVQQRVEWLLAAHRTAKGDGAAPSSAASQVEAGGTADASPVSTGEAEDGSEAEEEEEERLRAQIRDISRSLWGALSSGTASGSMEHQAGSRSQADFAYRTDAVAAMKADGELDGRHHRRRDAHSLYMEASARDAVLRRQGGGTAAVSRPGK